MNIRALQPEDLNDYRTSRLTALRDHPECFCSNYLRESQFSDETFLQRMAIAEGQMILGSFLNNELIGTIGIGRSSNDETHSSCFIWGMYVKEEHSGKGIGRALLNEAIQQLAPLDTVTRLELSVIENNTSAFNLYLSMGFEVYGQEPDAIVVDGISLGEVLMRRSLTA